MARKFFDRYQDRILFGTDAVPQGMETPPADLRREALRDLLPAFSRPRTNISTTRRPRFHPRGGGESTDWDCRTGILRKVYYENAARLLRI
jgi:predicted TIM-barrel fold metal-dependent hydrolase